MQSELSPEERDLLNDAGKKMRFWTNAGVIFGFMTFSLPVHARSGIRLRFLKGIAAGTAGIFLCGPVSSPQLLLQSIPNCRFA